MGSKWNSKQGPGEMLGGGASYGTSRFSSVAHQLLFAQARVGRSVCLLSPSVCLFLIRRRDVVASGSFSPPGPPVVRMRISYQMAEWVTRPYTAGENGAFKVYPLNRTPRHTQGHFHHSLCERWKGVQLPQSLRMSLRSGGMRRGGSEWSSFPVHDSPLGPLPPPPGASQADGALLAGSLLLIFTWTLFKH